MGGYSVINITLIYQQELHLFMQGPHFNKGAAVHAGPSFE